VRKVQGQGRFQIVPPFAESVGQPREPLAPLPEGNPGNVFSAWQCGQRALQVSPDPSFTRTELAWLAGTVRTTAPHSLQVMSV
jgi:hypothetical protein